MKKIISLVALALVAGTTIPAQAASVETIAVIDAYFNKSQLVGNFTEICVADSGCAATPTSVAVSSTTLTHGTIMAQIIAKNNPNAQVVLIRSGSVVGSKLYQASAREIANAFSAVPKTSSVVSISIYNNGSGCRPSTANAPGNAIVNVSLELSKTQQTINSLVGSGINVVAAAGNAPETNTANVDYPACLPNVTAVAKAAGNGDIRSQGGLNSELDIKVYPSVGLNGNFNTTSGITAAVAAKWSTIKSTIIPNSKQFVKLDVIN